MSSNSFFQKTGLAIASVLFSFLLLEFALRLVFPDDIKYFVWPPGLQHKFYPDTALMSGVEPASYFTISSFGLRTDTIDFRHGPDLFQPPKEKDRSAGLKYCLCMGASTTEDLYLDDSKTWPAQFANAAMANHDSTLRFVGNMGKSGCTIHENYIQLKYCVPQYKRINTVLVMAGLNDMIRRLSQDTLYKNDFHFTPAIEDSFVNTIFLKQGRGQGKTWLRRTALFYVLQSAYHKLKPSPVDWQIQDDNGKVYDTWRKNRQSASRFSDTLPDMNGALDDYGRMINLMIDEAQKQGLQIVFINESAIWKDTMPEFELSRLWQGGIGKFQMESGHAYYSPKALRQGLEMYNKKLAEVCSARHITVIDIDSQLPHNLSIFYDDLHFNVEGAREVGNIVYKEQKK